MPNQYKLSGWGRVSWAIALVSLPIISLTTVFGLTDDDIVLGQGSRTAEKYAAPIDTLTGSSEAAPTFSSTWGEPGERRTLVLYDGGGAYAQEAELYGIAAGNLATHFGEVTAIDVTKYTQNQMDNYDAVIYLGTEHELEMPRAFLTDVREGVVPVLWAAENIDELATVVSSNGQDFTDQYGWNALDPLTLDSEEMTTLNYKDHVVGRHTGGVEQVDSPRIHDEAGVEIVAHALCTESGVAQQCITDDPNYDGQSVPWAVRSANLTYIAELPLHYITENNVYLVFADMYYDLLASARTSVRQASVRFEDVGPEADPFQLRAIADYLHDRGIPFQVAVMPVQIDRTKSGDDWYGLTLLDAPHVVDALKYMQERGGTLIQHGTSHQYAATNNPYSGRSGDDYEFFRYGCSATELPPYQFEECDNDSWVRKVGPVPEDGVEQHKERMQEGRRIMGEAGLGEPDIFETPHYTASVNAYAAMAELYDARYEQSEYFAGTITNGEISTGFHYGQFFPYSVHDVYGQRVYPENLENISLQEQNNHPARPPKTLIDRAKANLVVRESTASFYFHPFLDLDYLTEVIDGIEGLGYEFVSVKELR